MELLELDLSGMTEQQMAQVWIEKVRKLLTDNLDMLQHDSSNSGRRSSNDAGHKDKSPMPSVITPNRTSSRTGAVSAGNSTAHTAAAAAAGGSKSNKKSSKSKSVATAAAAAAATASAEAAAGRRHASTADKGRSRHAASVDAAVAAFTAAATALFQEFRPGAPLSLRKVLALCKLIGKLACQLVLKDCLRRTTAPDSQQSIHCPSAHLPCLGYHWHSA